MLCQMLISDGIAVLVEAKPDFYVKDSDYEELMHSRELRLAMYRSLHEEGFTEKKIFIGNLGKEVDGVFGYDNATLKIEMPNNPTRRLGYYEKL